MTDARDDSAEPQPLTPATQPQGTEGSSPLEARITAYQPDLRRRGLPDSVWDEWRDELHARVLAGAAGIGQVTPMLGFSLDLIAFAYASKIAASPSNGFLWRETTRARFLGGMTDAGASKATVATAASHLARMASADPTTVELGAAPPVEPEAEASALFDSRSPLLVEGLGLADAEPYWHLLDLIGRNVRAEHGSGGRQGSIRPGRDQAVPYGLVEVTRALRTIDSIKVASTRSALRAMFALALGAGIDGYALALVKASDIHHDTDTDVVAVYVRDRAGSVCRTVPVLAPFAPMLLRLAADSGEQPLLGGQGGAGAKNRPSALARALRKRDPHAVRLDSTRLRATWVTIHLAGGTPLPDLMRLAGVTTPQPFADLVTYVPPVPLDLTQPWHRETTPGGHS